MPAKCVHWNWEPKGWGSHLTIILHTFSCPKLKETSPFHSFFLSFLLHSVIILGLVIRKGRWQPTFNEHDNIRHQPYRTIFSFFHFYRHIFPCRCCSGEIANAKTPFVICPSHVLGYKVYIMWTSYVRNSYFFFKLCFGGGIYIRVILGT